MKNESDLDDWIKLVPNEASVIYSQIDIKNHLKGVLRTFDTSYGINRRRGKLEKTQTVILDTDEESTMRLKVTESEFVKILKEGKFSEKATVLKEWKKMGYLKAQSDRYISQVKIIGDIKVKGYIIQLPISEDKIVKHATPRKKTVDEYDKQSFFDIEEDLSFLDEED